MAFLGRSAPIFCSAVLLGACGNGSDNNANAGANLDAGVVPFENSTANSATSAISEREQGILAAIKQRSVADGALYPFDELNPVFEQVGDQMNVSFTFIDANTVGGSPIVEYSLSRSEITRIEYTQ